MNVLMIDNYDSFTYNIVQYLGELGAQVQVFRNDEITLEGIADLKPTKLVLSPGPCSPAEAGICVLVGAANALSGSEGMELVFARADAGLAVSRAWAVC